MITENFVEINSIKINYTIFNSEFISENKPFLVFLHEGLGSIGQWKDFPEIISTKSKLPAMVYDRYGYGKSDKLKEERADDYLHTEAFHYLPEILTQLKISNKLILFGHSDGGSIALLFASAFPEKTQAVISEAAHVFIEQISIAGALKAKDDFESGKLKDALRKYHADNTESMFAGWVNKWSSMDFFDWNIEEALPKITAPVLVIQGRKDQYGTCEQVKSILNNTSGHSEPLIFDDCGHTPHFEKKDLVIDKVLKFVGNYK
ncbi:MAG: alpha/beta hydrolase [Saprospiraceae bacterium]|nr:alpha/beta hydrolase [Saprospiraceae bacterium]